MDEKDANKRLQEAMEAARERSAEPHPRDILKWEHDRQLTGNEALERRMSMLDELIWRDLEHMKHRHKEALGSRKPPTAIKPPKKKTRDLERE